MPFNLDELRKKKNKTKAEERRLKRFDEAKKKLPPFDAECKNCNRAIPKPLEFCSTKCKEEYRKKQRLIKDDTLNNIEE